MDIPHPPHQFVEISRDETFWSTQTSPLSSPRRGTRKYTTNPATTAQETGPWQCDNPHVYGVPVTGDPWEKCFKKVSRYDDDLCEGWRDEVDKLLIFAGLFFSAVTAFVIESYKQLQEDPLEKNSWLLEQLLIQQHNANLGIVIPGPLPTPPVFSPSPTDVRVNVFWFLSLSLALGTVLLGILCIQWLREYQREAPLDPQEAISLRQIRYEGLIAWKVPNILMALPVLLHLSLILFFLGLIHLLWALNQTVAFFVTITSGLVLLFVGITTFLPALQLYFISDKYLREPQCPYKSPQSWAVHQIITGSIRLTNPANRPWKQSFRATRYTPFFKHKDWVDYDNHWRDIRNKATTEKETKKGWFGLLLGRVRLTTSSTDGNGANATMSTTASSSDLVRGLVWIDQNLGQTLDMIYSMYHCIMELPSTSFAVETLRQINDRAGDFLNTDKAQGPLTRKSEKYREFLCTLYLEANIRAFPQLDQYRLESVVRILNSQLLSPPSPAVHKTDVDDGNGLSLPFIQWPFHDIRGLPNDLIIQLLMCVQLFVKHRPKSLSAEDSNNVWLVAEHVLSSVLHRETAFGEKTLVAVKHTFDVVWDLLECGFEGPASTKVKDLVDQVVSSDGFPAVAAQGKSILDAFGARGDLVYTTLSPTDTEQGVEGIHSGGGKTESNPC